MHFYWVPWVIFKIRQIYEILLYKMYFLTLRKILSNNMYHALRFLRKIIIKKMLS